MTREEKSREGNPTLPGRLRRPGWASIEDYTIDQAGKSKKIYAPVSFGSRKFNKAQYKHTIHTKEFLAIYYAFETFAHILWGVNKKPVVVFTDNKALSSFLQCPTIPAALCKYVDRLLQFNFVLTHVSGEDNPVADYLSRMYLNPHLLLELEIGAKLPVHEVTVKLKPNITIEEPIPNEDNSPPTPSPPESPRPEREEDMELPSINVLQLAKWTPEETLAALSQEDPMQKYSLMNKNEKLDMGKEQRKDKKLYQVMGWICNKKIPDVKYESSELRALAKQLSNLFITQDGVLLRKFHRHNGRDYDTQIVIPQHLRGEILHRLHNPKTEGHRGVRKTIEECRSRFYWPNYQEDIEAYIANCLTCIQLKPTPEQNIRPPLRGITHETSFPGDMMQIDLIGPFKPSAGYTQVMTAIDVFTKYLFAVPLRKVTARAMTDALTVIFLRHAYIPKILLTDKGSQLTSKLMKEMTTLFDIELRHATTKHAQTIGLLERTHASLKKVLKIYENRMHSDWHKYVDYAVFAHNTSRNPKTRTTPSDLFHGYTPHKAIDCRFGIAGKERPEFETMQQLQDRVRHLHGLQKQNILETYLKNKEHYDKKARAKPLPLHSYCLLLNPRLDTQKQRMDKMEPKWLALYRIEKSMSRDNYLIREVNTHHTQIVHRIRLRGYMPQGRVTDVPKVDPEKFVKDPKFDELDSEPALMDIVRENLFRRPEDITTEAPKEEKEPPKIKTKVRPYSNTPGVIYKPTPRPPMPPQTQRALEQIREVARRPVTRPQIQPQGRVLFPETTAQPEIPQMRMPIVKLQRIQLPEGLQVPQVPHTPQPSNQVMTEPPERTRAVRVQPRHPGEKRGAPVAMPPVPQKLATQPLKKAASTIGKLIRAKFPMRERKGPLTRLQAGKILRMPQRYTCSAMELYPAEEEVNIVEQDGGAELSDYEEITPYEEEVTKVTYDSDEELPYDEDAENDWEDIRALLWGSMKPKLIREKAQEPTQESPNDLRKISDSVTDTPTKTLPQASQTLQFHTGMMPPPTQPAEADDEDCTDIYVNFTTRERILNMNAKNSARKSTTPYGIPQVGDVRRYYDKTRKQYITSLIVSEKGRPITKDSLELALENLKVQAETLNAKNIHISLHQRALKPLTQLDMLYATEKAFMDTQLKVHVWTAQ